MNENELYAEQMKAWFAEHQFITEQLQRTTKHYEDLAEINRQQLELHLKRTTLATEEYNVWADQHGVPKHER